MTLKYEVYTTNNPTRMTIGERLKKIMMQKEQVGEFSLDIYYNDVDEARPFTIKIKKLHSNVSYIVIHIREESLEKALGKAECLINLFATKIINVGLEKF